MSVPAFADAAVDRLPAPLRRAANDDAGAQIENRPGPRSRPDGAGASSHGAALLGSGLLHLLFGLWLWQASKPQSIDPETRPAELSRVSVEWLPARAVQPPLPVPPMPQAPLRRQPRTIAAAPIEPPPPPPVGLVDVAQPVPVAVAEPAPPAPAEPLAEANADPAPLAAATPVDPARAKREQADYLRALMTWLIRHRSYPDAAKKDKAQGVVGVKFTLDRAGNVLSATVSNSSGRDVLDRAALDVLRRATPLPAMPESMRMRTLSITLPIEFSLTTD